MIILQTVFVNECLWQILHINSYADFLTSLETQVLVLGSWYEPFKNIKHIPILAISQDECIQVILS